MDLILGVDPKMLYGPVGRCIYCPNDGSDGLGDEHIIPYALNGSQILLQASCHKCEKITSYLDGFLARSVFYQVRTHGGARTRTKLPNEFEIFLCFEDGHEEHRMVPADIHPSVVAVPHFAMPDMLSGRTPDGNFHLRPLTWQRSALKIDEYVKSQGAKLGKVSLTVKPQQFSRALARIAHSYAVARLGINGFEPFLLDLIHGRNLDRAPELVGSLPEIPPPDKGILHRLDLFPHDTLAIVGIRLFASSSIEGEHAFPVYVVVAGKRVMP